MLNLNRAYFICITWIYGLWCLSMKYIYLLGACGSIGTQTLQVVDQYPEEYKIIGMSVGSNLKLAKD